MRRRSQAQKTARKRYSEEFREEALALSERFGVAAAAKELGLHESQLYAWWVRPAPSEIGVKRSRIRPSRLRG
jgi:transposase-like protein